jgi:hypothetical protein
MPDRSRRVKVKPEMNILDREIGGEDEGTIARSAQEGGVISDAEFQS